MTPLAYVYNDLSLNNKDNTMKKFDFGRFGLVAIKKMANERGLTEFIIIKRKVVYNWHKSCEIIYTKTDGKWVKGIEFWG